MSVVAHTSLQAELRGAVWRGPFQKRLDLPGDVADILELVLPQGETWVPVALYGWTSLLMLWITSNRDILVTLGDPTMNQPTPLRAGGVMGFAGGNVYAPTAAYVSYPGPTLTERAVVTVYAAGTVLPGVLPPTPLPPIIPIPPQPVFVFAALREITIMGYLTGIPIPPVPPLPPEAISGVLHQEAIMGKRLGA